MQKYISKTDKTDIRYFELDVNVSDWIDLDKYQLMTEDEIDRHENPEKYLTEEERIQLQRERMPILKPMDFDLKLNKFGLYQQVQDFIKTDIELSIAYNRALYFSRTDLFIEKARIALNLTNEEVDQMWQEPLKF
ncbi:MULTISPECIES: hypothetical protein [unclassified Acinetobacter]|uniref:hypothetical protein n=1 Tax=unclassified Acinetobacter TaxID=196816 RepID=UPI002934B8CE|nr:MULTISPECIES: hypothetical protein [unclassified Acinetobacter]WOE32193.1 hypothetical protein QSG84_02970 [Acinetobacter sp. SAAs470]WOE37663.1 hypothetical protein QSG86_12015 [Acinetobacter sp. SAAs474]